MPRKFDYDPLYHYRRRAWLLPAIDWLFTKWKYRPVAWGAAAAAAAAGIAYLIITK